MHDWTSWNNVGDVTNSLISSWAECFQQRMDMLLFAVAVAAPLAAAAYAGNVRARSAEFLAYHTWTGSLNINMTENRFVAVFR
ncbi:hypothetical protein PYCCODRAFT_1439259 [Trametes coccinea BRFM310]|uniref:Uncharacterized protein n=1 Tax=Trametes coccinea (strain BRFM310) TaxID=1353009 RepID=A0A1Y2IB94_TRAC3|nr:hypothetical protein PYCCODRAFT_1439259 [Trametes coccinea BRFM310]